MDSLTQIALGSAVSVAVMGRRTAVWKAALWGAVAGTLPDLDAFIDHGDAMLNMTRHRAESHALFFLTLAAPLLAWAVARLHGEAAGFKRRAAPSENRTPLGGSDPHSGGAWGQDFQRRAAPSLNRTPSGGSDPHSGGAWGQDFQRRAAPSLNRTPSGGSDPRSGGAWGRWTLALWLALITHPLLDAMTVYGTQLLQPFTDHPYGVGSVFIIDPAYTVPLIVGVVAAMRLKNTRGLRWNAAGLVLSTLYLVWGVVAQQHVERIARDSLRQNGIHPQGLLVTPAPFNTVLWRLVAVTPTRYFEGHYSLLDAQPTLRWTAHERGAALIAAHGSEPAVARMAAFTHGFYSLSETDGHLFVTDLRMGQEPAYTFRFNLGSATARANGGHRPTLEGMRPDLGTALPWLWQRLLGNDTPPPWQVTQGGRAG